MKVKDLIQKLQAEDQEAYVHIQTDRRFEEDVVKVESYENDNANIVLLSNHYFTMRARS